MCTKAQLCRTLLDDWRWHYQRFCTIVAVGTCLQLNISANKRRGANLMLPECWFFAMQLNNQSTFGQCIAVSAVWAVFDYDFIKNRRFASMFSLNDPVTLKRINPTDNERTTSVCVRQCLFWCFFCPANALELRWCSLDSPENVCPIQFLNMLFYALYPVDLRWRCLMISISKRWHTTTPKIYYSRVMSRLGGVDCVNKSPLGIKCVL